MLRGRAVCGEGAQQLALQELLQNPFEIRVEGEGEAVRQVETGGEIVTLELIRTKNKCSSNTVGALYGTRDVLLSRSVMRTLRDEKGRWESSAVCLSFHA
jgi:hypothetical protein